MSISGKDFQIHELQAPLWLVSQRPCARSKNICRNLVLVKWQTEESQTPRDINMLVNDCMVENEIKLLQ